MSKLKVRLNKLVNVELCEYLTEDSVYLQYNVMLWIKKIVSENARNVVGVEKSKHFQGENTTAPPPPSLLSHMTPHWNFSSPTTTRHLSTPRIVWCLFVDARPRFPPLTSSTRKGLRCNDDSNLSWDNKANKMLGLLKRTCPLIEHMQQNKANPISRIC
jgi:hypothetical protein